MPASDQTEEMSDRPTVAVIGAGISGLICARSLVERGYRVRIFEKSRGVGGRMATRRAMDGACTFDHGAQYFTCRDDRFRSFIDTHSREGRAARWQGRIVSWDDGTVEEKHGTERFVAVPGMNSIAKSLAPGLDIELYCRVAPLQRFGNQWKLVSDAGRDLGVFDLVVVSAPAGQTAELLSEASTMAERASEVVMSGCWTLMLALEAPLQCEFDAAFVHNSSLSWIARNSSKSGRTTNYDAWVLHATPKWSEQNIDTARAEVETQLLEEFGRIVGTSSFSVAHQASHLWRFALPEEPLADSYLFDEELQIGACGDWCGGPRVEGAFLSGLALAERIIQCCPQAPSGR